MRNLSIANGSQLVHPTGQPINHSTHRGFNLPGCWPLIRLRFAAHFCIDGLSKAKQDSLKRRGQLDDGYAPKLLALDLRTGKEIWSTDEDVFGTFLSYSDEHDVLLQAGSSFRDRATDEAATGAIAYRGADGEVLWKDLRRTLAGPCLLHGETIITQDSAFELLTGNLVAEELTQQLRGRL